MNAEIKCKDEHFKESPKRKMLPIMYIISFLLILIAPTLMINRESGKISETENRYLAAFPDIFDEDGKLSVNLRSGFESWLGDNIGFRSDFIKLATNVKIKCLHQSTSNKVEIGRDGWYFYTPDHNIELASGEFTLSQEMLQEIADKQQQISDWYEERGIVYILVLTASKASIYPEYIVSRECRVQNTLCDQLEQYLNKHTTVQVLNTKHYLLANKTRGKVYLKTDTHWTQLGSYIVYQAIAAKLNTLGIKTSPFSVNFVESKQKGEFSAMLGAVNILGEESVPSAQWDSFAREVKDGELYNNLTALNNHNIETRNYSIILYENQTAENGTLLIYGDSQWTPSRNLPQWFGESFKTVVSTRFRSLNVGLDKTVQPDVVIFGCSERMIDTILTRNVNLPNIVSNLPNIPEKSMISQSNYGEWIANQGICLDTCNDIRLEGSATISIDSTVSSIDLFGWAADFYCDMPFQDLYLQVGDFLLKCDYHIDRTSVVDHFGKDSLLKTGFRVTIPVEYLQNNAVTEISFIGVSADGEYIYTPVTYQVSYT